MSRNRYQKSLSAVEARPERSNQHEFNGVAQLKQMLGMESRNFIGRFSLHGTSVTAEVEVTWYDARAGHPTRSEHRLYFPPNAVMRHASEGDLVDFVLISDTELSITLLTKTI